MTPSLLLAIVILAWGRATRKPWSDFGLARTSLIVVALGAVFGAALKLVLKAIVLPLLGTSPVNAHYHYLVGNTGALPGMLFTIILGAGFGEEVVFRGFLFDRVRRFGGPLWVAVVVSATLFGLAHLSDQGTDGAVQAAIVGLVIGTIYARTKNLWPCVAAHIAFDLVALAIIYFGLEERVAHLVFR